MTAADLVSGSRPLPSTWTDHGMPWADPVERAGRIAARIVAGAQKTKDQLMLALVVCDVPKDTVSVELGWDRNRAREPMPAFYLVAMEGLTASESFRADWDSQTLDREQEALVTALTQDPDDHALLVPGQSYTVQVSWRAESKQQEAKPAPTTAPIVGPSTMQEFRFGAVPATDSPKDLSPWLLCSAPSMDETGVLCRQPVRIALATQNVAQLFDAYGEELRVLVKSASGKHPEPPGGGAPGAAVTIPIGVGGIVKHASPMLAVMTPWEQTVRELLPELRCISGVGERTRHHIIELAYEFEPLTDYLIDVVAVPKGAPQSANQSGRRIHRIGFTTSRFESVTEIAALIGDAALEHRLVMNPASITALTDRPTGDQLDTAYQGAGLGVAQVPRSSRVQLLWTGEAVPQPFAVVIECSEAMWRERLLPTQVPGPSDAYDPGHTWWAARSGDWLALATSTASAPTGDPPTVIPTRIIRGPGGTRAIVVLPPGSRGKQVRLDLLEAPDPLAGVAAVRTLAAGVNCLRAPWEVED